ncbi:MAG: glycosyltransferase [Parcubacteria group bacterium]
MKICIISNFYKPHSIGGAERVAEATAEEFARLGHRVFVITTQSERGSTLENQSGVKVYRFHQTNICRYSDLKKHNIFFKMFWHFFNEFNIGAYFKVKKILIADKPDAIITHNLMGMGFTVPAAIRNLKIKHIHVVHDVQLASIGIIVKSKENSFLVNGSLVKIYRLINRWLFSSPAIVVSPSEWLMKFYDKRGFFKNSKRIVLQNPLTNPFDSAKTPKKTKTGNFLCINQLERHKGIEWLVDFWRKNNIKNELLICGKGSLLNNEKFIKELPSSVKIIETMSADEQQITFVNYDFFIMPSLCYENSPTVIPLAYQNGTPVIVSDIGGSVELVENGKTGFTFLPGDNSSFLAALNKAIGLSNEKYAEMSRACLERSKSLIVDNYVKKLIDMVF